MNKIAGYCRISVDEEIDRDNTSIENQKAIIAEYAKKNFKGSKVTFYCDRDRSGYTFEQREEYQKLRKKLLKGEFNVLIVKDFSRFSRRNSKGLVELEDLRDAGVRIIAIGDSIDYPTYDDWLAIQFRFLINEMPVTDTSKKVKNVIHRRQSDGKWICAVPYGYVITDSKRMIFEVDEAAAAVVRRIFELYNQGWGYKKIANFLTDEKIPTPRMREKALKEAMGIESKVKARSEWSIITVQGIIENDFYIGTLRQGKYKRKNINGSDIKLDKSEHIVFEKNHTPIVDEKTFAMAREQLEKRSRGNYRGVRKYDTSYSGFLFCGDCGSPMFSMSRPELAPAYTCGTYHRRGLKGCTSHHIRVDVLDELIKSYLTMVMDNSKDMLDELERNLKAEPTYIDSNANLINKLENDLEQAKAQLKNMTRQKLREIAKNPTYAESIEEIYEEVEKEQLDAIEGIKNQINAGLKQRSNIVDINRKARSVMDVFENILNKKHLDKNDIGCLIEKIIVCEDHLDIKLRADIDKLLRLNMTNVRKKSVINFEFDTDGKSSSQYTICPEVKNQRARVIGVNIICDGDPLEIYTDSSGEIVLKKYSPIGELASFAKEYAESLAQSVGHITCIVDKDQVIAVSGGKRKEFMEKHISDELEQVMNSRSTHIAQRSESGFVPILENEPDNSLYTGELITPIISEGDVLGAVVMLSNGSKMGEVEGKLAQTAAGFLGKQMEQ